MNFLSAETGRLQTLAERLLRLAQVEQRRGLEESTRIALRPLVAELLAECAPRLELGDVTATNAVPEQAAAQGERFLLRLALLNLIDNAIEFTPRGGRLTVGVDAGSQQQRPALSLWVHNEGGAIPGYALPRVTERFYSLARPGTGRKSTGLGLNLVQEVAQLHGGSFRIVNEAGGVRAELTLPAA